jgi:hypothetical protein
MDFIDHIPEAKFTHPDSCYSFIVRFDSAESMVEIYFPPGVEIAADFNSWLIQHKFRVHAGNPQLWTSFLSLFGRKKAVRELLQKATANGAYQIEPDTTVEQIQDRSNVDSSLPNRQDLATTIADKINALIAGKLEKVVSQNQAAIAEYKEKIEVLEKVVKEQEQEIKQLKQECRKQKQDLFKLSEYERILGIGEREVVSPFSAIARDDLEAEDISHLNSPFRGGDLEILDSNEYDETEYNQNISPARIELGDCSKIKLDENGKLDLPILPPREDAPPGEMRSESLCEAVPFRVRANAKALASRRPLKQEARKADGGVPPLKAIEQEARKADGGVPPLKAIEQEEVSLSDINLELNVEDIANELLESV